MDNNIILDEGLLEQINLLNEFNALYDEFKGGSRARTSYFEWFKFFVMLILMISSFYFIYLYHKEKKRIEKFHSYSRRNN